MKPPFRKENDAEKMRTHSKKENNKKIINYAEKTVRFRFLKELGTAWIFSSPEPKAPGELIV